MIAFLLLWLSFQLEKEGCICSGFYGPPRHTELLDPNANDANDTSYYLEDWFNSFIPIKVKPSG